jgi:hypothetical protein
MVEAESDGGLVLLLRADSIPPMEIYSLGGDWPCPCRTGPLRVRECSPFFWKGEQNLDVSIKSFHDLLHAQNHPQMLSWCARSRGFRNCGARDGRPSRSCRQGRYCARPREQSGIGRYAVPAAAGFHTPRIRVALRRFGIPIVYSAHARHFEVRDLYSAPRELIAYCQHSIRRYEVPAG